MSTPTVSENEIERLRSDVDTIRSAMGRGLPFTLVDIRYCWVAAATLTLYGVLYHVGLRDGGVRMAAFSPFLTATVGYMICMALKSRKKSGEGTVLRKEYRLAVLVVVLLTGGLLALRPWAVKQGIEPDAFNGVVAMTLGLVFCFATLLPFTIAVAFRRATMVLAGAMLLVLGWIIITLDGVAQHGWVVATAVFTFIGNAVLMNCFRRRENAEAEADAT